mgnify:CR=1 FL=1
MPSKPPSGFSRSKSNEFSNDKSPISKNPTFTISISLENIPEDSSISNADGSVHDD